MPGPSKRRKSAPVPGNRRVWARLGGGLLILVLLALLGGLAYLGTWPPLKIVMSPSMEPAIETGDLVVVKALDGTPQVGEVIVVPVPLEVQERFRYPAEVMHRVIGITEDGLVRTQGDNLPEPDPFGVPVDEVSGRIIEVIPGVGKTFAFFASPYGLAWLVAGLMLFGVVPFFGSQRELAGAVEEYGYHLRSHTQILKSMSAASQDLAATVVDLREALTEGRAPASASPATVAAADRPPDPGTSPAGDGSGPVAQPDAEREQGAKQVGLPKAVAQPGPGDVKPRPVADPKPAAKPAAEPAPRPKPVVQPQLPLEPLPAARPVLYDDEMNPASEPVFPREHPMPRR